MTPAAVAFREVLAIKAGLRVAAELARWRSSGRAKHNEPKDEIAVADRVIMGAGFMFMIWVTTQVILVARWIITGRGAGIRALVRLL